jgi:hypothetical protein
MLAAVWFPHNQQPVEYVFRGASAVPVAFPKALVRSHTTYAYDVMVPLA